MMKYVICVILSILAITGSTLSAAPKPAVVQEPYQWTIDITFEHPQEITLKLKNKKPEKYWYMIITLLNKTDQDIDFYPKCELVTDTFEVIPAIMGGPESVFKKIKKRHRGKYPFLEPLDNIRLLQGEDNMRDIAIIWPDFDAKAKGIKIFIAGLSNETVAIDHPIAKDKTGKPTKIYLRKTLELSYKLSGDAAFRSADKLVYESKHWVMR